MNGLAAPVLPARPATGHRPVPRRPAPAPAPAVDLSTRRSVTAHVTGGLDGTLRVVTMLRSRRYRVRGLVVDVREDVPSRVSCAVVLTAAELDLMLARLRRMPTVVSAAESV